MQFLLVTFLYNCKHIQTKWCLLNGPSRAEAMSCDRWQCGSIAPHSVSPFFRKDPQWRRAARNVCHCVFQVATVVYLFSILSISSCRPILVSLNCLPSTMPLFTLQPTRWNSPAKLLSLRLSATAIDNCSSRSRVCARAFFFICRA